MRAQLAPELTEKLKKQDVRIRISFKEAINIFSKDPTDSMLDNHELHKEWEGFRSIDITADLRAVYQEDTEGDEPLAYFVAFGSHEELYKSPYSMNERNL